MLIARQQGSPLPDRRELHHPPLRPAAAGATVIAIRRLPLSGCRRIPPGNIVNPVPVLLISLMLSWFLRSPHPVLIKLVVV